VSQPDLPRAADQLHLYGDSRDRDAWRIRDFLTRSVVQYRWVPLDTDAECLATLGVPLDGARLPSVRFPDGAELFRPTVADIAARLGWIARPRLQEYDVSIYGAGPAGLSAALYAASEGLTVALVERGAVGGQAGSSSLIENYLGFPHGIRGAELAERARQQAVSFGVELLLLREGIKGTFRDNHLHADLADGGELVARANICATGVEWRRLGLPDEERLLGAGLYYGAGTSEAPMCRGEHVYVVGGANSAGQAAMHLAQDAAEVTMLVRGEALADTMSEYLRARIEAHPRINVLVRSRVVELVGEDRLKQIVIEHRADPRRENADPRRENADPRRENVDTEHLFVCIGGAPNTEWADETTILRDRLGFMVTGPDIPADELAVRWPLTDRKPFYLESTVPGSFAAGDVRFNSVKRVASAVGEGAMAVTFVHRYLAETFG
jgi:thioredoxin reductase (NADPH)